MPAVFRQKIKKDEEFKAAIKCWKTIEVMFKKCPPSGNFPVPYAVKNEIAELVGRKSPHIKEDALNLQVISDQQLKIGDWVAVHYNNKLYPDEITEIVSVTEIKVNAMVSVGRNSFKWPSKSDNLSYQISDIIKNISHPVSYWQ